MAQGFTNAESGRRGNWKYMYGSHAWVPLLDRDWSLGMVSDRPKSLIPEGGAVAVVDFLVHQPGALIGRGPTAYAGPALTSATYGAAVAYAEYPAGSKLVGVGDNGHIYTVTSGSTTDLGGSTVTTLDTPKLRIGGGKNLLIFPQSNGTGAPIKYDGSAAPAGLSGTPAAGKFSALYKSRLALGNSTANPNRVYFSPTPDIESTWDTTNSWVDFDHSVTGLASLQNTLVVFSLGHTERLTGSTPPGQDGSDFDRQPIGDIGCSDARSIAIYEGNAIFANPRGVYMTNGTGFQSLTSKPDGTGIEQYWQSLFPSYDPATWILAGGVLRNFYFVSLISNSGTLMSSLCCYLPRLAWTTMTNIKPTMFATAVGAQDELYYADRSTNRIVQMSGVLVAGRIVAVGGAVDANGTAVTPSFISRAYGGGSGLKAFGDVTVTADLIDQSFIPQNPTIAVAYGVNENPDSYTTSPDSPFTAVTTAPLARRRVFSTGVDSQELTVTLTQATRSTSTVIRSIEVGMRPYPWTSGGQ